MFDYVVLEYVVCEFKVVVIEGNIGLEKVFEKCGF